MTRAEHIVSIRTARAALAAAPRGGDYTSRGEREDLRHDLFGAQLRARDELGIELLAAMSLDREVAL